jgi:YVTN family beta-propeller protein
MMMTILNKFIFFVILNFLIGILVICIISGPTYGQLQTLYELAKHTPNQKAAITVGLVPYAITTIIHGKVYVANREDGTVSVISALNNTKIGNDIKVGKGPDAIGVDYSQDRVYVANYDDGTVSVISALNNTKIGNDIKVGKGPDAIGVEQFGHKVYVANFGNNTVSVINSKNNTNIGKDIKVGKGPDAIGFDNAKAYVADIADGKVSVIALRNDTNIGEDIKVGKGPDAIGVDYSQDRVYVANSENDTVSVIDPLTDKKIGNDIKVGGGPDAISVDDSLDRVYVANAIKGTVSLINSKNNTNIGNDIKVGGGPNAISVEQFGHILYVTNSFDNTVSVIDEATNNVVAAVTFTVNPFNAGHIECGKDRLIAPVVQQFYIWSGSECKAKPNQGFDFVSWQENLGGNSSRVLQFASPSPFFEPILDFLHLTPDKPEATFNITKFGSFTANFKALPPPIPPEYVATLFTVVVTALVGSWLTPTVIGWRKARKEGSKLDHYHNEVKKLYNEGKLDMNDIQGLNNLRDNIKDQYIRGKINKEQYDKLVDEISISYDEIFTKEIDSLSKLSENDKVKQLSATIRNIEYMHASLKKETSILYQELYKKRIDSLNSLPENSKGKLLAEIKDDISDAYSKEKISELHYSFLKERLLSYEKPKV